MSASGRWWQKRWRHAARQRRREAHRPVEGRGGLAVGWRGGPCRGSRPRVSGWEGGQAVRVMGRRAAASCGAGRRGYNLLQEETGQAAATDGHSPGQWASVGKGTMAAESPTGEVGGLFCRASWQITASSIGRAIPARERPMDERLYGRNKWSYGVTERPDGWIEVRVYHTNRTMYRLLEQHAANPRCFLSRRVAFSGSECSL